MIALIGLLCLLSTSIVALSKKTHLAVPFVVIPVIAGMLCGFPFDEVLGFAHTGVNATFNSVLMCVFAVLYFSVLSETGFFDIMVNRLVGMTKGNIYVVLVVTIVIGFIGHLDGAYNTTFLIAIPALAPLYRKLNIDRRLLVLLVAMAAAPMTAMAWAQPAKMIMYDPDINPVLMTQRVAPVIAIMFVLGVVYALIQARIISSKNAAFLANIRKQYESGNADDTKLDWSDKPLARPQNFWMNFVLFIVSLLCFVFMTKVKTYLLFMLFSSIAMLLNYHNGKDQGTIVRKYSATMLAPGFLFMCIGVMVGILNGTGMVTAMVDAMLSVVPQSLARYTHDLWAVLVLPLEVFIPYQAFQSVTPLLLGIGTACGLNSYQVLSTQLISYLNPCSPLVAANNLAAELADVDIMDLAKFAIGPCILFNTIHVILLVVLGIT